MSYRGIDVKAATATDRPLIDYINGDNLDVSDEEDGFYSKDDDDYVIHPKWKAMINRTSNRVPRRLQRYFVIYVGLLIFTYISWKTYLGPRWEANRQELRDMDDTPKTLYGTNMRPDFTDMIQLKTMDEKHLPKGTEGKRLIVVGDLHGCKEELEALLKKVDFNKENDHLIATGDMIAKGPDSPGVISLLMSLGASAVRGNHEDRTLLSIAEQSAHHAPLPGPEEPTDRASDFLDEESFSHGDYKVRALSKQFSKKQIHWLSQCPVILRVGPVTGVGNLIVVHAGLVPGIPLERQDPFQVMNMRTIDLKTRVPSEGREGTPWERFWNYQMKKLPVHERQTVIYGHDRKRGKRIEKYSKGLDTGCVGGGKLTAMIIEPGKEKLVSVKCKTYIQ
ncbi:Metallo-dependent phosphatase-like protein [Clohesyomyces aquaticus]|uniref:Metallo-dependent phosphatase-like protein n=1 Tax=Clohesyomyces aquaticus TaxID=1231657 RepID=A0A1Y1Y8I0_9PLEO|nr:Metallo-dependent phosphatase-like protein [Clohesyomyces aquaticus]